ncbi:MAG: phosphoglycolate phosphatase [Parcubacteria group bacterium]
MHDLRDLTGATIAFDLDGTLVDTAPDLVGTLNIVLAEEGLPPVPFDEARPMIGRGARALLERGFTAAGEPLDGPRSNALVTRFVDLYLGRIADESAPFPGVTETLAALRDAGARLSVCTNKRTNLSLALLDALGLSPLFDAIVGADAAPASKPDPRHLFTAVEQAGGDTGRAVFVGDSETDISTARNARLPIVAVTFGYTEAPCADLGPDALIDSFEELPSAVTRLLASQY